MQAPDESGRRGPRWVHGADARVVAKQLGRVPQRMSRVARRCPHGLPAVVENLPYDERERPFPTLFWATCPTLVAAVSSLEDAGGVSRFQRLAEVHDELAASLAEAVAFTRERRSVLAARYGQRGRDCGASLHTGVGGVADPRRLKCLHAHAAHALARSPYRLGDEILAAAGGLWCRDARCRTFADETGADDDVDDACRGGVSAR